MTISSEYQIVEQLYKSDNSIIYRALQKVNNCPVILKLLKNNYNTNKVVDFKREYQIISNLKIDNAIKSYALKEDCNTLAIIFEDFGGQSLDLFLKKKKFSLNDFLKIAIQTTMGLAEIHVANIIHKDINPSNIVYNLESGQLKIIDFGISTDLSRENTSYKNPNVLEGTLAYISPEQTGRMNRVLDYRTDFYSLGVTFYELLTQKFPFEATDRLELISCQIAKKPIEPHKISSDIPKVLSNIVMKLMAKDVKDRYQSALGLQADLKKCQRQLFSKGKIIVFSIGKDDLSDRFQISQKLYGRKQEIEKLLNKFKRVTQGANQIILIQGYSGIGKSALVREVYKPITETKGYFINGKFDQYQSNRPYSAIAQSFYQLAKYLLAESEINLDLWKNILLKALKNNGQVIIDLIPTIEQIIGKQPPVADLSPTEAQNRFNLVFINFIKVFAKREHPLVIFLDDLQWADSASLQLIQLITTDSEIESLFLIGAYRDNEVSSGHPLILTIDKLRQAEVNISEISLSALKLSDVAKLIGDTFSCTPEAASPLAELILAKTNGNPFFINEFLRSLYIENFLFFNYKDRIWEWNLENIKAKNITNNVVELLSRSIQKLNRETQKILQIAACIGNQFEISTLASIARKSIQETTLLIREAIEKGFVFPITNNYNSIDLNLSYINSKLKIECKFAHDRIQQASYALISANQKHILHRQIGELLLNNISLDRQEDKIFDIVNQFNLSVQIVTTLSPKNELAKLNLIASKKAKEATDFELSLKYLKFTLDKLFDESNWINNYEFSLELYTQAIELAYLNGEFKLLEKWAKIVLQILKNKQNILDTVKIQEIRIKAYIAQNKFSDAVKIALCFVKELKIVLHFNPSLSDIQLERKKISNNLFLNSNQRFVDDLIELPEMRDPYKSAALQILDSIINALYFSNPLLFCFVTFKAINLMLESGNTPVSIRFYLTYGMILIAEDNISFGYKFVILADKLFTRINIKRKFHTLYLIRMLGIWKNDLKSGV